MSVSPILAPPCGQPLDLCSRPFPILSGWVSKPDPPGSLPLKVTDLSSVVPLAVLSAFPWERIPIHACPGPCSVVNLRLGAGSVGRLPKTPVRPTSRPYPHETWTQLENLSSLK